VSPSFELSLDRDRFRPGETVNGNVRVVEGGRSRSVEVFLNYCERTADYSAVTRGVASGPLHQGDLQPGQSFSFALQLPPDALPRYSSSNAAIYWEVDVKSDERGIDTHERREIEVEPPP
jgi:hypothetical protein